MPKIIEYNVQTGEQIERELTDEEIAQLPAPPAPQETPEPQGYGEQQ